MLQHLDEALERLIAPMRADEFFRDYYGRKTLIIRGTPDKFAAIYDEERWRTVPLAETTAVYQTEYDGVPLSRVVPIPPAQLHQFFEAGLLTVGRLDAQPQIAALMDGLRASLQFPSGKVSNVDKALCFASRGNTGYKLHWDLHHNFILQIAGAKHWRYGHEPAVDAPVDGAGLAGPGEPAIHYDGQAILTPRLEDLAEDTLHPGDFLYMPPGVWHAPCSLGHSNHISIALGHRPIYKLISDVLKLEIGRKRWWRQGFPALRGADRHSGAVPEHVMGLFAEAIARLRDELAELDLRQLHKEWSLEVAEHHGGRPKTPPAPVTMHERLTRATPVPIRYCLAASEDDPSETEVYIFAGDERYVRLPEGAQQFVARLAAEQEFVAESALQWDPDFEWPEVQGALTRLLAEGILVRAA
ncbi:cupin domain-containing protein [Nannocystis sp. SCPEA4]|uniref:JmjC domain-containing protein n=1 Tax=Nannocystis sp. SCPEA4 TaxID=2996787 RepID=UPI002271CDA0|nr:cupin domain-containing protein [Nannocystis sp. SCPEA4]MCY1062653.1 hypothetical protein [Nannocystis sp. SCPEA4]